MHAAVDALDPIAAVHKDIRRWLSQNPLRSVPLLAELAGVPQLLLQAALRELAPLDPRTAGRIRRALGPLLGP
jgi:hypothetical protein